MKPTKTVNLLFLCTGNAARSQIAEGIARKYGKNNIGVKSAGVTPAKIHKYVYLVMEEIGIDISDQYPKMVTPELIREADYVIILCDYAKRQCPSIPLGVKSLFWPMPDPYSSIGTEEEVIGCFRYVRDKIKEKIINHLRKLKIITT